MARERHAILVVFVSHGATATELAGVRSGRPRSALQVKERVKLIKFIAVAVTATDVI